MDPRKACARLRAKQWSLAMLTEDPLVSGLGIKPLVLVRELAQ